MERRDIARPDAFFAQIHRGSLKGRVVLERKFARQRCCHSQVAPDDAERIARLSYKIPDLSFSVASFLGMPLLTNFGSTNCLYIQLPCSDGVQRRLYSLVEEQGFSLPTVVVTDGERVTFYWVLKRSVERSGFHKVYLMQHGLWRLVEELRPYTDSLNIGHLVPLVGTINSRTNGYVGVISHTGKMLDNKFAEDYLMRSFGIHDHESLKRHSRGILELLALLHDRVIPLGFAGSVEDWLIFFGASLCRFCGSEQLVKELQAIAVSLEAKRWNQIEIKYGPLIRGLAQTAVQGYIVDRGSYISIDKDDWFSLVSGKLCVSPDERDRLGLAVLVDSDDIAIPRIELQKVHPVGELNFVPIERFFMKAVA